MAKSYRKNTHTSKRKKKAGKVKKALDFPTLLPRGWLWLWLWVAADIGKEPSRYCDHLRSSGSFSSWTWSSLSGVDSGQRKMSLWKKELLFCISTVSVLFMLL
ncbi:hypothetical protein MUK42_36058 [Musa troglodytarum]|uniref:Uncharacterized protein n=1 Tax=Musa troglodytarum TaxID=320322 RepID=A0A9E7ECB8_9LILI|nr:hypothetical protein MUK42_36058 [Musa troglodytarum]